MSELPPPLPPTPLQPLRVETLSYHTPGFEHRRPGILIAVGILSIIFGLFHMLTGCSGIFSAIAFGSMSTQRTVRTLPPAMQRRAVINYSTQMTADQRRTIVGFLGRATDLSELRREMLDLLLRQSGDEMFAFGGNQITEQMLALSVSQSGHLSAGRDYFVLISGRVEVSDDDAVFLPVNGQSVRVNRKEDNAADSVTTNPTAPTPARIVTSSSPQMRGVAIVIAVTSAVNLLLAIFLLIAGILVLRNSRRGRWTHLAYAILKLPLALIGAVAYWLMIEQLISTLSGPRNPATFTRIITIALQAALPSIYPVALLIVMNTKTVTDYYRSRTVK